MLPFDLDGTTFSQDESFKLAVPMHGTGPFSLRALIVQTLRENIRSAIDRSEVPDWASDDRQMKYFEQIVSETTSAPSWERALSDCWNNDVTILRIEVLAREFKHGDLDVREPRVFYDRPAVGEEEDESAGEIVLEPASGAGSIGIHPVGQSAVFDFAPSVKLLLGRVKKLLAKRP